MLEESAGIFALPILVTIMGHLPVLGFSFLPYKMMRWCKIVSKSYPVLKQYPIIIIQDYLSLACPLQVFFILGILLKPRIIVPCVCALGEGHCVKKEIQ